MHNIHASSVLEVRIYPYNSNIDVRVDHSIFVCQIYSSLAQPEGRTGESCAYIVDASASSVRRVRIHVHCTDNQHMLVARFVLIIFDIFRRVRYFVFQECAQVLKFNV